MTNVNSRCVLIFLGKRQVVVMYVEKVETGRPLLAFLYSKKVGVGAIYHLE